MDEAMDEAMTYIVNVSGGLASYEALRRTLEQHSAAQTVAVFADTRAENADLYRFLDDIERLLGIELVRLADGRTPKQVMMDERCITIGTMAPCSRILKHEVIDRWVTEHFADKPKTLVFGFDWTEPHRAERIAERMAPTPVWCPLLEPPYVTKQEIGFQLEAQGVQIPLLYRLGFSHNNCDRKCVRAGQGHYAHLLRVSPDTYAEIEQDEQEISAYLGKEVTILRDRSNGESTPLSLAAFRQRIKRNEPYERDLWGGCGCFME